MHMLHSLSGTIPYHARRQQQQRALTLSGTIPHLLRLLLLLTLHMPSGAWLNHCRGSGHIQWHCAENFSKQSSSPVAEAEKVLDRICTDRGGRTTRVTTTVDLSSISPPSILSSSTPSSSSSSQGTFTIFHHISHRRLGQQQPIASQGCQEMILIPKTRLNIASYNLRGLKRFGRQAELSHLLDIHRFDFIGLQETKCTGNTISNLGAGFLFNSSDNPFPGKEDHRGTGLVFRKNFAPAPRKTYQGSSRWCGAVFLAKPVPLLILSAYAPTASADPGEKDKFYQDLSEIVAENGGSLVIILGDFNARILDSRKTRDSRDTLGKTFSRAHTH